MKQGCKLGVEQLERRDALSATVTVSPAGVLNVVADNQVNYLVASTPAVGATEIFDAVAGKATDFTGVTSLRFQGNGGNLTVYNNTSLPSLQVAGSGKVNVLVGGTGNDTLVGGSAPDGVTYEQDPAGNNLLVGGAGDNNLFGGKNADTIISAGKSDEVYDILGSNQYFSVGNPAGYVISNFGSPAFVSPRQTSIVFFQPTTNPVPALLTQDVNGNGILWLNPVAGQSGVTYRIDEAGSQYVVTYTDATGTQTFRFAKSQVQWIASFGTPGNDQYFDGSEANDVLYGAAGDDTLSGSYGQTNVLKGHSGNDVLVPHATRVADISAGPGSATLAGTPNGQTIFRNATPTLQTRDIGVQPGDIVIGAPLTLNGRFLASISRPAGNGDFQALLAWQQANKTN